MQETALQEEIEPAVLKTHPDEWVKNGFHYRIVMRYRMVVMVEVTRPNSGMPMSWEVSVLQFNPAGERFGKQFQESESYPPPESWGTKGFTCTTLEAADRRFLSLT